MSYKATITTDLDPEQLYKVFAPELEDAKKGFNDRASYSVEKKPGKLMFKVEAKDSTSLRAVLNSITKLVSIYERVRNVVENERNTTADKRNRAKPADPAHAKKRD
jgi:tRNA threonylcarbamoyladenosine modification (KEOPS) complex  Pcc1 subunit